MSARRTVEVGGEKNIDRASGGDNGQGGHTHTSITSKECDTLDT